MELKNPNPFPEIQIINLDKIRRCGSAFIHFFTQRHVEHESLLDSALDAPDYIDEGQLSLW